MSAPKLMTLESWLQVSSRPVRVPRGWRRGRVFAVVAAGRFQGRDYSPGDLVLCDPEADGGQPVVLVARGRGRPRLGTLQGARLLGDCGEPCSPQRWLVAGRVVSVLRPRRPGEGAPGGCARPGRQGVGGPLHALPPAGAGPQLALFTARAA